MTTIGMDGMDNRWSVFKKEVAFSLLLPPEPNKDFDPSSQAHLRSMQHLRWKRANRSVDVKGKKGGICAVGVGVHTGLPDSSSCMFLRVEQIVILFPRVRLSPKTEKLSFGTIGVIGSPLVTMYLAIK